MTEVIIIRHGETQWNTEHRLQGWRDTDLNEVGLEQAHALAKRIAHEHHHDNRPIDQVYSSDLKRAYQTAQTVATAVGLEVLVEPGIRERNFGVLEGVKFSEMFEEQPEAAAIWQRRQPDEDLPLGESLQTLHDRAIQTVNDIARRHPEGRIVLVTHGGTMDVLWRHATQSPLETPRVAKLANASINRIYVGETTWQLIEWGDVAHLGGFTNANTGFFR
jgi:probable phosphoglycerate mutase|tara:strand:- start:99 stop:755 length:657 start_codon:yes stop_codon:yes gene_type:complete